MPNLRRDFINGRMDLDTEGRRLPDGVFRRGDNIYVINSESSDVGSIKKSYSNKQLTNINFGGNAKCLLGLNDEYEKKIYWFIHSNNGCYLIEWDDINQTYAIVLEDTRPVGSRVLNLDPNKFITGVFKIINDDPNKNLFVWTDDNIEPCCINLARAKTFGANNFDKEDIYLVKKPPVNAPGILPINIPGVTNNKLERFFSFCYRFKFLDGEYSALSTYANYDFNPKAFDLNFYTLDNKGMVNAFNAAKISFDTGDKRVTDIQLVFKESNSNALYLIETFNKANLGWGDSQTKDYVFSNNKSYTVLPEDELYRNADYVPLKAKALTYIGNRALFGNYVEGRDIVDANGVKIVPDYQVSMTNELLDSGSDFTLIYPTGNQMQVTNPGSLQLLQGMKLVFFFNLLLDGSASYQNSFYYILPQDYATLADVFASLDFEAFLNIIDADIKINFQYDSPDGWNIDVEPSVTYTIVGGIPTFTITPVTFIDTTSGDTPHTLNFSFVNNSYVTLVISSNATSCKSNRDYEVGIVYEDDFCRKSTVLTALYNTIHIAQLYSTFKNKLRITLNSPAPFWAKRFRLVVKAQPLQYQIIYVNRFYNEDFYVWAKLEAENKDKVKVGDILVVKKGPDPIVTPVEVKVLEIKEQIKDFITGNIDLDGNPIIEEAGLYMKIRAEGFSMDFDNFKINSAEAHASSGGQPIAYLDLFTDLTGSTELALPQGSSISLYFDSTFHWDSGWRHNVYDVIHYAQRNYTDIEEWFNENIIGRSLFITNTVNVVRDYGPQLSLVRGNVVGEFAGNPIFTADPAGKLYLKVKGLETGGSGGRKGRVDAKIVVRSSSGFYVFETQPKQADNKLFYETPQTFEITDGNHAGNVQDQDLGALAPAIIDLDFFNCYAQGNGVESYRVRDGFNTNALNIDLRPSVAMIEEYKSIRRKATLIYGDKYVEATNSNRLNEFNLSTNPFKDLDKQYGSIQKLHARDNDVAVFQEEKTSKVLFEKTAVTDADGVESLVTSDVVLGEQRTYLGENGIGLKPESFAENDFQIYYLNSRRGLPQRLSIDGVEPINQGMIDWFRDVFIARPNAKMLGGYDPYHKQYFVSIGEQPAQIFNVGCGSVINRFNQTEPFTYSFNLNGLMGDIVLNYNIVGHATIVVNFDGNVYPESNVTGEGEIIIPRDDTSVISATVTVTPVDGAASYTITSVCPLGVPMEIVNIVLGGTEDDTKTMTTRYRWNESPYYSDVANFTESYISRFLTETGIEGQGKFPMRGSVVRIESKKDISNSGNFSTEKCNRIGYLITEDTYTEADIETIKSEAVWLSLTEFEDTFFGNFLLSKTTDEEKLYLIWDFEDKKPELSDDEISVLNGTSAIINMLGNDIVLDDFTVEIITEPTNGTVVLNEDNTITYTHDGSETVDDIIEYRVTQNGCSSTAIISLSIYTEGEAPTLFRYRVGKSNATVYNCAGSTSPRYVWVNVQPFSSLDWFLSITQIFEDEEGTIPSPAAWYSDVYTSIGGGFNYVHWNGEAVDDTGECEGDGGLG